MNLSTRGRYGLRALLQLALMGETQPVPLNVIAEKQGISVPYLEQLIAPLRKSGLVRSVRGAHGGYLLGQSPDQITVGEILRVLEGPIAPAECARESFATSDFDMCLQGPDCVVRELLVEIRDSILQVIDNVTLADMVEREEQRLRS